MLPVQVSETEFPEQPPEWLLKPANDAAAVYHDSDGDARNSSPSADQHPSNRLRHGGLIMTAGFGFAVAAAAAVLTVGWFGGADPRSGPDLSMATKGKPPGLLQATRASARTDAPPRDLTEGLNTLRSQMQANHEFSATSPPRSDVATIGELEPTKRSIDPANAVGVAAQGRHNPVSDVAMSQPELSSDDMRATLDRAKGLIAIGDITAARRLAEYVAARGNGDALFTLAETFDPKQLARWRVRGVRAIRSEHAYSTVEHFSRA